MKKAKPILIIIGLIIIVIASYSFGFGAGKVGEFFRPNVGFNLINRDQGKPKDLDFSKFWDVWSKIHEKYVGEINDEDLVNGAIAGMVSGLDDPYSALLLPKESQGLIEELSGTFGGVGIEITVRDGNLTVVAPLDDSPAEQAGVRAKDVILKIDDKEAANLTFEEAVQAIRGKPGTKVTLTILRQGLEGLKEIEIEREEIKVSSVEYEKKDNIAYLKLRQFGTDTTSLLQNYAKEIKKDSTIKGVVLDLRNNPGGFLDTAIEVASVFIEDGVIVYEESKSGAQKPYEAQGRAYLSGTPLVVLINEGSASGSEIVAGAIQDWGIGKLIGKTTFGKGSVQDLEDLGGGFALKITTAKWLTPNGRTINGEGIDPDIEVDLTDEDIKNDRDPQLDRAIEELKK